MGPHPGIAAVLARSDARRRGLGLLALLDPADESADRGEQTHDETVPPITDTPREGDDRP